MNNLQRVSWILGAVLLGASAVILFQRSEESRGQRRRINEEHPVEELAEELKAAWAGYHNA